MFRSYIVSHLSDLVDVGVEESLDRVQGVGASGVSVAVTSGAVGQLRSAAKATPRVFRSRGGFFFQPDDERYGDTRLKPIVSTWLKGRNPLEKVVDVCRKRGLELRLRLSAFEVGRIARRYPEAAAQTVFGDPAPGTLCPASPDVRALLRATVDDLSRAYAPTAIELGDLRYHSGALAGEGLEIGFEPGDAFLSLLGICFSESSRQSAVEGGVDAAAAARWVKVELDKVLCSGKPTKAGMEKMLEDAEIPRQYVQCQVETLDTVLVDIAETAGPGITLVVPAETSGQILPSTAAARGAGSVVVQGEAPEGGEFDGFVRLGRDRWGGGVELAMELDAAAESGAHPQQLVSTVKRATDAGTATVMFSSFGLIPQGGFDAVKQAIRYASRTSS